MAEGRRRVKERFGVELEPEVQALGPVDFPADWPGAMGSGRSSIRRWAAPAASAPASGPAPPVRISARRRPGRSQAPPRAAPAGRASLLAPLVAILLLGGVWLWLRDSSLVAVQHGDASPGPAGPTPPRSAPR